MAAGSRWGVYRNTAKIQKDRAMGSVYLHNPRAYRRHLTIQQYTHCKFPSVWSLPLFPIFRRSLQFVWFLTARYPTVCSHPLHVPLKQQMLIHMNSLSMPQEVSWSDGDTLFYYFLRLFITGFIKMVSPI